MSYQYCHEKFDEFWPEHSKVSKICTLMATFWPKYVMLELKKYRGVMFDSSKYWYKTWSEVDLSFQNWHEEFDKISQAEK